MDELKLTEAYARLRSLRQNVPTGDVEEKYVAEYHAVLDLLSGVSQTTLSQFQVPPDELRPVVTSWNYLTGQTQYSTERYCDYAYFCMKIDGVLTMFEVLTAPAPENGARIGFKPSST